MIASGVRAGRHNFYAEGVVFTGNETTDFLELAYVFGVIAVTLGLMVVFGIWWSR